MSMFAERKSIPRLTNLHHKPFAKTQQSTIPLLQLPPQSQPPQKQTQYITDYDAFYPHGGAWPPAAHTTPTILSNSTSVAPSQPIQSASEPALDWTFPPSWSYLPTTPNMDVDESTTRLNKSAAWINDPFFFMSDTVAAPASAIATITTGVVAEQSPLPSISILETQQRRQALIKMFHVRLESDTPSPQIASDLKFYVSSRNSTDTVKWEFKRTWTSLDGFENTEACGHCVTSPLKKASDVVVLDAHRAHPRDYLPLSSYQIHVTRHIGNQSAFLTTHFNVTYKQSLCIDDVEALARGHFSSTNNTLADRLMRFVSQTL